jgi:hypothetical protein
MSSAETKSGASAKRPNTTVFETAWQVKPYTTEPQNVDDAFEHFRAWTRGEEPPSPDHVVLPPPKN